MLPRTIEADEWHHLTPGRGENHPYIDFDLVDDPPTYLAYVGDDFLESHDDLEALLAELADVPGDVAVWRGDVLAAVLQAGRVTVFEPQPADDRDKHSNRKRRPAPQLFGRAVTAILAWMGKRGWSFSEARGVLLRLKIQIASHHIGRLIRAGRSGKLRSIRLEAEYVQQLEEHRSWVLAGG
jgi:hypothetical protein